MDFFGAQDKARQNTGRLVIFFTMAVISLIVMTNLLVMTVFGYLGSSTDQVDGAISLSFNWDVFVVVSLGVFLVVGLGSLYKIMALSGGGDRIAEMLDGQLIVDGTGDPDQQKILNVVEEMAIASGSPVPPVYLLKEEGINAFAAGYSPSDAVIGVTRGAIRKLSRDELQGVIAHEFSHIHNGDMRLNIRLIGILHGILLLGLIGYHVLRGSAYSRSSKKEGGGALALGLGLVVIGFAGTFFGNLIKAAVSRQREFLADASAVQFTRNPDGIGGALQRIGADSVGSVLANTNSAEISHALFSQGFTSFFGGLFATHPPLAERIKKIKPDWDGKFERSKGAARQQSVAGVTERKVGGPERATAILGTMAAAIGRDAAFAQIGNPTAAHLGYARELISQLPDILKRGVREPFVARAVIYCLVLDDDEDMCRRQLAHLAEQADTGVYEETVRLRNVVRNLKVEHRLPLVDMALPTLRRLSKSQYARFKENLNVLIEADGKISLFEWTLQKIVSHHLDGLFAGKTRVIPENTTLQNLRQGCALLLSLLVYSNRHQGLTEQQVFKAAAQELGELEIELLDRNLLSFKKLDEVIDQFAGLAPQEKSKLVKACAACVMADHKVDPVEAELLRAIADTLDCPMPPLVTG
ncbi:MAG: M48 family metallopeptidase [Proteobacteria bacterium]|nr:M48 family metallopeptidase [Pseudomonadota bacterium]MBU1715120.1 M48 family metallopeptidase [Pseudomonadota bacterium]